MMSIAIFGLAIAIVIIGVGWVVHRDLTARGVDPVPVLIFLYFLWPVGLYLWVKRRNENPHPTLRP